VDDGTSPTLPKEFSFKIQRDQELIEFSPLEFWVLLHFCVRADAVIIYPGHHRSKSLRITAIALIILAPNKGGAHASLGPLLSGRNLIIALLGAVAAFVPTTANAKAEFSAQTKLPCGQCHTNPSGGGKLKAFVEKFKANGNKLPK
jgi:hypothetical protein